MSDLNFPPAVPAPQPRPEFSGSTVWKDLTGAPVDVFAAIWRHRELGELTHVGGSTELPDGQITVRIRLRAAAARELPAPTAEPRRRASAWDASRVSAWVFAGCAVAVGTTATWRVAALIRDVTTNYAASILHIMAIAACAALALGLIAWVSRPSGCPGLPRHCGGCK